MLGDVHAVTQLVENPLIKLEVKPLLVNTPATALSMALEAGHLEIATLLFNHKASIQEIAAAKIHHHCKSLFKENCSELFSPKLKSASFFVLLLICFVL